MRLPVLLLAASLLLTAQTPRPAEVQERRLPNGVRLLLVERRNLTAFHATLVFRGGRAEEPAALAGATDLLARTLYGGTWPEDLTGTPAAGPLDTLLVEEEGLMEALRLERLHQRKDPAAGIQIPALEAGLQALQARLRTHLAAAPLEDLYAARGGRQRALAGSDALLVESELPQESFEFWCRTELQRLTALRLSRFVPTRQALATELRRQGPRALALLRGAALPGHPYGRDLADHLPTLEALRRSDLRTYAQQVCSPGRLMVIVVGGLGMDTVLPLVERTFGTLPAGEAAEVPLLPEIAADLGDRRVSAALGSAPRLLVGWRIPPRSHPDHLALALATQLLGGGRSSRLPSRLVDRLGLALRVDLQLDVPGGRLPGLLVADLTPAEGHSLAEVESALHAEILRLQQEPIPAEEWQRALTQLEMDHLVAQDEPATLARGLGLAWVETGDWRRPDLDIQRLRKLGPEAVQVVARTWLRPSHRTTAHLQPNLDDANDPVEVETARVLKALAATRIEDLAQREHLVTEGLRQLRMLSAEERQRTLKLLEAQLAPEKR